MISMSCLHGLRAGTVAVCLAGATAAGISAQDVEALGSRYGTRPPQAYFDQVVRDPLAFQFARGRPARVRAAMAAAGQVGGDEVLRVLGPRDGPVVGTVTIPVVLGLFQDTPAEPAFTSEEIHAAYFGSSGATITDYYLEVSGGRLTLQGELKGWVRSTKTRAEVTAGNSGLGAGTTGRFISDLLAQMGDVDWGLYDNDGPDGVANSGDDDGYVDALAVLQPTAGAECGGPDQANRIWSHRWSLTAAAGTSFITTVAGANGGFIRIDDYVIQPIYSCNGRDLNEIGVFTHELGHAFGLPDLYDTYQGDGKHGGAGYWDLMASGSYGCDGASEESPCHLSAWSKATLGWANVVTLPPGLPLESYSLPPVETSGTVYRIDAMDDSGEYFLLENRQRIGFDQRLLGEGLFIWQIDPGVIQANWGWNGVNGFQHMGVWLRQADGKDELGTVGGGRGGRSDVFPTAENDVFHAASNPSARSWEGTATGLTITGITRADRDVTFSLSTRFTLLTVRTEGDGGSVGLLTVDDTPVAATSHEILSAPFEDHRLEAAAGEPLGPGRRRGFEAWDDDPSAARVRTITTPVEDADFVARYGPEELELAMEVRGGVGGIDPGSFISQPASSDLWFEADASVRIEAVAQTGFAFREWTGDLAGMTNPATFTMTAPMSAGVDFDFIYEVPSVEVQVEAAAAQNIQLVVENGTPPFHWSFLNGVMPQGLTVNAVGQITGAAMVLGDFPVTLRARDAIGLEGEAVVTLKVVTPNLALDQLASDFLSVGPALTEDQRRFLDRSGNGDGVYDLGDFRAWVLANPQLPLSAMIQAILMDPRIVTVPTRPPDPREEGGR